LIVKIKQSYLKKVIADFLHNKRVESNEACPSNEDLVTWARSKLPKKEKNRITDHIVNCCHCAQKVHELLDRIRKENGIIYEIKKYIDSVIDEESIDFESLNLPRVIKGEKQVVVEQRPASVYLPAVSAEVKSIKNPLQSLDKGNGEIIFSSWYANKFGQLNIVAQVIMWIFYGFIWIPILYLKSQKAIG